MICHSQEEHETQQKHAQQVSAMFAGIVRWYDPLNRILSLGFDQRWRTALAKTAALACDPQKTQDTYMLDLAAGTLDVALALQRECPQSRIVAMDFCLPMLLQGKSKVQDLSPESFILSAADARKLPLPDACMDAVTMAFGIRNIVPRSEAFQEIYRVLTPGGRLCLLEFGSGKQRIWKGIYNVYLGTVLPLIGKLFSGDKTAYTYLADTICAFPLPHELADELRVAGFHTVSHFPLTSGIVRLHVAEKNYV